MSMGYSLVAATIYEEEPWQQVSQSDIIVAVISSLTLILVLCCFLVFFYSKTSLYSFKTKVTSLTKNGKIKSIGSSSHTLLINIPGIPSNFVSQRICFTEIMLKVNI
jgi:hypothetical protein